MALYSLLLLFSGSVTVLPACRLAGSVLETG